MEVWFKMQTALAFCSTACDISVRRTLHGRIGACNRISPSAEVNYILSIAPTFSPQNKIKRTALAVSIGDSGKSPMPSYL